MKKVIGSKSELFRRDDHQTWLCKSPSLLVSSDVIFQVGEITFNLHKFPLLSRSGAIENLIAASTSSVFKLQDVPGGANAFLLVAKFCYGVKLELSASNAVILRCAAEYLQMAEDYGEGNLISQTENFLSQIFGNWTDTLTALETCEQVLEHAEELHIVSRCINSLAVKACADSSLFSWPVSEHTLGDDWWYEDVCFLKFPLYKRLILTLVSRDMNPEKVAGSLMFYAKRHICLTAAPHRKAPISADEDQLTLLEEIVELFPDEVLTMPTDFLFRLLKTAIVLHASSSCRENLEKRVGAQLGQAVLEDLIIPNMGYSVETLYDIDCVQRILDHFMTMVDKDAMEHTPCIVEEDQFMRGSNSLAPMTMVANLVDAYLAEVAPDANLKLLKFQSLADVIPDHARSLDDGLYRAIDIFLKAHPWLTESEREQLCRLMNCQKLSLEASTHAAQNERLPLRVIVQVLFFEQLRLRTSISSWFFVSDNLENSQNMNDNLALTKIEQSTELGSSEDDQLFAVDDMKERVSDIEKECKKMKQDIEKLAKTKGSWNVFWQKLGFGLKSRCSEPKASKARNLDYASLIASIRPLENGRQKRENHCLGD